MSMDSVEPRSRRALLLGGLGAALASVAALVQAPVARAGEDGDVILDDTNAAEGTTEIIGVGAPTFRVIGGDVAIQAGGAIGIDAGGTAVAVSGASTLESGIGVVGWSRAFSTGVIGFSTDGNTGSPTPPAKTGVYGLSEEDDTAAVGVLGRATSGIGVAAQSATGPAVDARSEESAGVIGVGPLGFVPDPLDFLAGLYGTASQHPGVYGRGQWSQGVRGDSYQSDGVYGEALNDVPAAHSHPSGYYGVHGHGGWAGVLGTGNDGTIGVQAKSTSAPALLASNESATVAAIVADGGPGTAIHGHANDGGLNQADIPPSPSLTGVYGSASGLGVGVYGAAAGNATGVRADSEAGNALDVTGKVKLNRSGIAWIPPNRDSVDVTIPGGTSAASMVHAVLQVRRAGVSVIAVRPGYPSVGKARIYLNQVASTSASTPVAWFALL